MVRVHLSPLHPDDLEACWDRILSTLSWRTAMPLDPHALRARLRVEMSVLWLAPDWRYPSRFSSAIKTTIVVRPRQQRMLLIEMLSGRHIGTWIESAACTLGQYAHAHGCTHLHFVGRRGWSGYRTLFSSAGRTVTWAYAERAADAADNHHHFPNRDTAKATESNRK